MILTLKEKERLNRAADRLYRMGRTGRLGTLRVPANVFAATECLLNMDSKSHVAETITEEVAQFYAARGFAVRHKGIGWQIAPSQRVLGKANGKVTWIAHSAA